jgi:hypothetical protein
MAQKRQQGEGLETPDPEVAGIVRVPILVHALIVPPNDYKVEN